MAEAVPQGLLLPEQVAREAATHRSPNGIAFSSFGDTDLPQHDLDRLVGAVPVTIAQQIGRSAYFFVPLAMSRNRLPDPAPNADEETLVARTFSSELSEQATCHRNVLLGETDAVFISTRLLNDRFALSFEFFIHVGHAFADAVPLPAEFSKLAWSQAENNVRGETSQDSWEARALARGTSTAHPDRQESAESEPGTQGASPESSREKLRDEFLHTAFADAIAIYLLSLAVDFDYSELREREYPLLAAPSLADRLRLVASLYPPNAGYEFSIRYRRRA